MDGLQPPERRVSLCDHKLSLVVKADFKKLRVSSQENDFTSEEYKERGPCNNLMTFILKNSVCMWLWNFRL